MAWILIVFLIFLGGLIAPFGDILGTKIGKARFSILKLRPKKTATIITIITGGFISSISIGLLILVSEEFRQRLFVDIPLLQKTLDKSKKALIPLQKERKELESKIIQKENELNQLKSSIKEFRRGNIVIKRGQTLFIAEINSSSNIKLDLTKIYNEADKFARQVVIPINKDAKNILLWRPSDIEKIERIASRSDQMLKDGAINEVKRFLKLKIKKDNSSNKVIGISEIKEHLEKKLDLKEVHEKISIKTRQYAKRQSTWARGHMSSWNKINSNDLKKFLKKI